MYEKPDMEILMFLEQDVLDLSPGDWEDWEDENADPDGWV